MWLLTLHPCSIYHHVDDVVFVHFDYASVVETAERIKSVAAVELRLFRLKPIIPIETNMPTQMVFCIQKMQ